MLQPTEEMAGFRHRESKELVVAGRLTAASTMSLYARVAGRAINGVKRWKVADGDWIVFDALEKVWSFGPLEFVMIFGPQRELDEFAPVDLKPAVIRRRRWKLPPVHLVRVNHATFEALSTEEAS